MEDTEVKLLEFPCEFPIKVMGPAAQDFDVVVVGIVRRHVADLTEGAVRRRLSRSGKYLSLTVTIAARSQAQLDGLYRELSSDQRILVVL